MEKFETTFGHWVLKYRWWIIFVSLIMVGLAGSGGQYLTFTNNYRIFFSEDNPELLEPLRDLIRQYQALDDTLTLSIPTQVGTDRPQPGEPDEPLPTFPGYRTIERLGRGGGGAVYKLEDLELGRIVAGNFLPAREVVRPPT